MQKNSSGQEEEISGEQVSMSFCQVDNPTKPAGHTVIEIFPEYENHQSTWFMDT
jgi:hypothetical protein